MGFSSTNIAANQAAEATAPKTPAAAPTNPYGSGVGSGAPTGANPGKGTWAAGLTTYGASSNFTGFNASNYAGQNNNTYSDVQPGQIPGGLAYLNPEQTVAIDSTGQVYVMTNTLTTTHGLGGGQQQTAGWQPYNPVNNNSTDNNNYNLFGFGTDTQTGLVDGAAEIADAKQAVTAAANSAAANKGASGLPSGPGTTNTPGLRGLGTPTTGHFDGTTPSSVLPSGVGGAPGANPTNLNAPGIPNVNAPGTSNPTAPPLPTVNGIAPGSTNLSGAVGTIAATLGGSTAAQEQSGVISGSNVPDVGAGINASNQATGAGVPASAAASTMTPNTGASVSTGPAPTTPAAQQAQTASAGSALGASLSGLTATTTQTQAEADITNPANTQYIQGLTNAIKTGNNAVTANTQQQAIQSANAERLAAGKNTLSGNYAAEGAAAQGQEALLGQQNIQQGNMAGAQESLANEQELGTALANQSTAAISADQAGMNQQISNISDEIQTLQNSIQGNTDAQSLQLQQYTNTLTNLINQYQTQAASGNYSQSQLLQIAQGIFSGVGAAAAIIAAVA